MIIYTGSYSDYLLGYTDKFNDIDLIVTSDHKNIVPNLSSKGTIFDNEVYLRGWTYFGNFLLDIFIRDNFDEFIMIDGLYHAKLEYKLNCSKRALQLCNDNYRQKLINKIKMYEELL